MVLSFVEFACLSPRLAQLSAKPLDRAISRGINRRALPGASVGRAHL